VFFVFFGKKVAKKDFEAYILSSLDANMKTVTSLLFILFLFAASFVQAAPVRVVATIEPLADWARMVGGDDVTVETLLAPGHSPHTYDPTPGDMRKTVEASVFLKVGLHLDDWADHIANAGASRDGVTTPCQLLSLGDWLKASALLPDLSGIEPKSGVVTRIGHAGAHDDGDEAHHHEEGHGTDPHFWLDPILAQRCVDEIARALCVVAPERADCWKAGAARARGELAVLDDVLSSTVASCSRREIACFHDGYKYLAARYGLIRVAVIEEYAGKAPGERYLIELVRDIKRSKLTAIFAEPQMSSRIANVIAQEAGVRVLILDPLGGTPGRETYLKNMRANAAAIRDALK